MSLKTITPIYTILCRAIKCHALGKTYTLAPYSSTPVGLTCKHQATLEANGQRRSSLCTEIPLLVSRQCGIKGTGELPEAAASSATPLSSSPLCLKCIKNQVPDNQVIGLKIVSFKYQKFRYFSFCLLVLEYSGLRFSNSLCNNAG